MATIQLSEAQREAIRDEIHTVSTGCADIPLSFKPDRDGETDRAFIVRKISELRRWVAVLDVIGWQETTDDDLVAINVDPEMAMWARGQAVELEIACEQCNVASDGRPGAALSGLRAIAEAA